MLASTIVVYNNGDLVDLYGDYGDYHVDAGYYLWRFDDESW